jgi:purine-binding chemotaxis protein CheW
VTGPTRDQSAHAVLKRRAEQLARLPTSTQLGDEVEVLACRLGDERYALETRHLRAVQWASGITPVPSTPAWVLGIVSVRGEIVTLLDLSAMLGLGSSATMDAESYPVLLLGLAGLRAGLVVDEVLGIERIRLDQLVPSPTRREFTRGIAPRQTVLLDLEALFASGRFNVADE